jgi:hypothetical protein
MHFLRIIGYGLILWCIAFGLTIAAPDLYIASLFVRIAVGFTLCIVAHILAGWVGIRSARAALVCALVWVIIVTVLDALFITPFIPGLFSYVSTVGILVLIAAGPLMHIHPHRASNGHESV